MKTQTLAILRRHSKSRLRFSTLALLLVVALAFGCKPPPGQMDEEEVQIVPPDPMTVLLIGDESLGKDIERYWSADRGGQIEVKLLRLQEWIADDFKVEKNTDLVVFPPMFLGELCERDRLTPIRKEQWYGDFDGDGGGKNPINKSSLLTHFRGQTALYNRRPFGLPLGSPHLVLMLNQKAFGNDVQIEFWSELNKRLHSDSFKASSSELDLGEGPPRLDLPLGQGWASTTFLARVAPGVLSLGSFSPLFDSDSMKPLITRQPFVEALDELKSNCSKRSTELDPQSVYQLILDGKSIGGMCFPSSGFEMETPESNKNPDVYVTAVPGSETGFDSRTKSWKPRHEMEPDHVDYFGFSGLMVAMSKSSRYPGTAFELMTWLANRKTSAKLISGVPVAGPFRASHLGDIGRWSGDHLPLAAGDQFAEVIRQAHQRPLVLKFPRIPGVKQYLDAMDQKIRECIANDLDSLETLQAIAVEWETITESKGRKKQAKAMSRDLGF